MCFSNGVCAEYIRKARSSTESDKPEKKATRRKGKERKKVRHKALSLSLTRFIASNFRPVRALPRLTNAPWQQPSTFFSVKTTFRSPDVAAASTPPRIYCRIYIHVSTGIKKKKQVEEKNSNFSKTTINIANIIAEALCSRRAEKERAVKRYAATRY